MKHLLFLPLLLLLGSCSHETSNTTGWTGSYATLTERGGNMAETMPEYKNRMVIYNASLGLAVKKPDSVNNNLVRIAQRYQGYALNLGTTSSTIRVKADQLTAALNDVSALGKIRYKNISGNDVTEEFHDMEIRLENARKARDKYLDLLQKAENVEAALKVEKELERLNGEIDLLEGKQKRLLHLNAFSTISVQYSEKKKPGLLGYIGIGLYKSVKWLFVRN